MSDTLASFVDAMHAAGVGPERVGDITSDDRWHSYKLAGDRAGKKAGYYRLKIDGDFAVGNFGSHREGVTHNWHSKASKHYSPEEIAAYKAKLAAEKKEAEKRRKEDQDNITRAAKLIWDKSQLATDHPYLARKQIQPHGIRLYKDDLIIPVFVGGVFKCLQTITVDGDKFFSFKDDEDKWVKGSPFQGGYYHLAHKDDSKDRIIICEGFATAASIREATGCIVICAFNAGNLAAVAEFFRHRYPDAQIIIASDNDQWSWDGRAKAKHCPPDLVTSDIPGDDERWKNWRAADGWLVNTGVVKANQAAAKIGGAHVIWPDFPPDDKDKRTDYNDLAVSEGLEAVKARVLSVPEKKKPSKALAVMVSTENFKDFMKIKRVSKDGIQVWYEENSINYSLYVQHHPRLQGVFAWDEFHLTTMVVKCPPWTEDEGKAHLFDVHELDEADVRECDYFIQRLEGGLRGNEGKTRGAIEDSALRNSIHPARDNFDRMVWDGSPRLDNWLIDWLGCEKDDPDYVRAVGRTWLLAAVKRIYEPGCKFDQMLVLEGPQRAGKSTALEIMATFGDPGHEKRYFMDTLKISNCEDPDELMKLTGALIVEIQEMSGFNKKDDDALKAFISTKEDTYRAPYARKTKKWPRQFVLAGTYNPLDGIFKDPTGLSRFWVVATGKKIDLDGLKAASKQIWAEAVHRYKAGEGLVLSQEIYAKAAEAADSRRIIDDMTHDVLNACRGRAFFEVREIMVSMGIPVKGKSQQESRAIGKILAVEGFQRVQKKRSGRSVWGWQPGPDVELPHYDEGEAVDTGPEYEIPFEDMEAMF